MTGRSERYERLASEAHVWWAPPLEPWSPRAEQLCRSVLSPDERARYDRFRRPQSQAIFLHAHALLRGVLSQYAERAPTDWAFDTGVHGRPELAAASAAGGELRFNLSHTRGLAACVVTRTIDCGIDVEQVRRADQRLARADRLLSPEEAASLATLQPALRRRRFFVHWTLKEAYLKARGLGLTVEVAQARFAVDPTGTAQPRLDPQLEDRAEDWQFAWYEPTEEHALSVALRRAASTPRRVVLRQVVPWDLIAACG